MLGTVSQEGGWPKVLIVVVLVSVLTVMGKRNVTNVSVVSVLLAREEGLFVVLMRSLHMSLEIKNAHMEGMLSAPQTLNGKSFRQMSGFHSFAVTYHKLAHQKEYLPRRKANCGWLVELWSR